MITQRVIFVTEMSSRPTSVSSYESAPSTSSYPPDPIDESGGGSEIDDLLDEAMSEEEPDAAPELAPEPIREPSPEPEVTLREPPQMRRVPSGRRRVMERAISSPAEDTEDLISIDSYR